MTANWKGRGTYYPGTIAALNLPADASKVASGEAAASISRADEAVAPATEPAAPAPAAMAAPAVPRLAAPNCALKSAGPSLPVPAAEAAASQSKRRKRHVPASVAGFFPGDEVSLLCSRRLASSPFAAVASSGRIVDSGHGRYQVQIATGEIVHARRTALAHLNASVPLVDAAPSRSAEALATAEREELTLVKSDSSATGYKNVYCADGEYRVRCWKGGRNQHLGMFPTVEEAALAYARHLGKEQSAQEAAKAAEEAAAMTAEEVQAAADKEGLELVRSDDNKTGFRNVTLNTQNKRRPFDAMISLDGRGKQFLGCFVTPEEAALYLAHVEEGMKERNEGHLIVPPKFNKEHKPRAKPKPAAEPPLAVPQPLQSPMATAMAVPAAMHMPQLPFAVLTPLPMQPLGYFPPRF